MTPKQPATAADYNEAADDLRQILDYPNRLLLDQALIYAHEHGRSEAAAPTSGSLREALEQIVNLYTDNRTRPASFAIQAGEIAMAALAATPEPEGLDADVLALLREFAGSGVTFDDERLDYVEVQVPRTVWNEAARLMRERQP